MPRTQTEVLTLEFEGLPPTVNMMYRGLQGHRYKTQEAQNYQADVTQQLTNAWGEQPPLTGRVALHITFTTPSRRRWDIDNRVKALQDCLAPSGVVKDDSQVDILHVERRHGDFEKTEVKLYVLEEK